MDKCQNFAANLSAVRELRNLTLAEFSLELAIPKSTLKDILKDGNTSLHTALHIAEQLGVSLSTLTGEPLSEEHTDLLSAVLKYCSFFAQLPKERQEKIMYHLQIILKELQHDGTEFSS